MTTAVGYEPHFSHSAGQFHKGGPPVGHFGQILDIPDEIPVPGRNYTFKEPILAQADGDYRAPVRRGRPVIRVRTPESLSAVPA